MKLVFMGTPQFAVPTLEALVASQHEIVLVVTNPDRPAGRGRKLRPPPVRLAAEKAGLPLLQPDSIDAAGMAVVDAISRLPTANLNASLPTTPVINYTAPPLRNANLVTVTMVPVASHALNPTTGQIDIQVDAGSAGRLAVSLNIVSLAPQGIIQVDSTKVRPLTGNVSNLATFTESDNLLRIPELWVDGVVGYRNVVFRLPDAETFRFTLVSFAQ